MKKITTIELGRFEVISGKVVISDPCYDVDTRCNGILGSVKNGNWSAKVIKGNGDGGMWGDRCAILLATHDSYGVIDYDHPNFEREDFVVGVDSGQAGIFNYDHFKNDDSVGGVERLHCEVICEDEPWYSICCDRTLTELGAGTMPFGCVSSSGYGDGSYHCETVKEDDEVVAIKIDFGVLEED